MAAETTTYTVQSKHVTSVGCYVVLNRSNLDACVVYPPIEEFDGLWLGDEVVIHLERVS